MFKAHGPYKRNDRVLLGAPSIIANAPNIFLKYQNCSCVFFAIVMGVCEGGS